MLFRLYTIEMLIAWIKGLHNFWKNELKSKVYAHDRPHWPAEAEVALDEGLSGQFPVLHPAHLSYSGTPWSALSICRPHPAHVDFWHPDNILIYIRLFIVR